MEKEFVPYIESLALKELGFNEPCFKKYVAGCLWSNPTTPEIYKDIHPNSSDCLAPTFSQAFNFFEENYFLSGETIKQAPYQKVTQPYWWYMIQDSKGNDLSDWQNRFNDILDKAYQNIKGNFVDDDKFAKFLYDDKFAFKTRNDAKLACLVKLIEIVKEKKL